MRLSAYFMAAFFLSMSGQAHGAESKAAEKSFKLISKGWTVLHESSDDVILKKGTSKAEALLLGYKRQLDGEFDPKALVQALPDALPILRKVAKERAVRGYHLYEVSTRKVNHLGFNSAVQIEGSYFDTGGGQQQFAQRIYWRGNTLYFAYYQKPGRTLGDPQEVNSTLDKIQPIARGRAPTQDTEVVNSTLKIAPAASDDSTEQPPPPTSTISPNDLPSECDIEIVKTLFHSGIDAYAFIKCIWDNKEPLKEQAGQAVDSLKQFANIVKNNPSLLWTLAHVVSGVIAANVEADTTANKQAVAKFVESQVEKVQTEKKAFDSLPDKQKTEKIKEKYIELCKVIGNFVGPGGKTKLAAWGLTAVRVAGNAERFGERFQQCDEQHKAHEFIDQILRPVVPRETFIKN